MHLSNRYMDLSRIVSAIAEADGWAALNKIHEPTNEEKARYRFPSDVMVLARDNIVLDGWRDHGWAERPDPTGVAPWTDDYSNVLAAILRRQGWM